MGEAKRSRGLLAPNSYSERDVSRSSTFQVGAPSPDKSSSKKVAAKLFNLHGVVAATFFRPCLGGAQSIAYRNVALMANLYNHSGILKSWIRPEATPPDLFPPLAPDIEADCPVPMKKAYSPGLNSESKIILYILIPT
jgi:hypothetical protein